MRKLLNLLLSRHGRHSDWSGQALVEFALVLPILLMLLIGIIDLGRALFVYNQVSNATREAARFGANTDVVNPSTQKLDCASIQARAQSMFSIAPSTLNVNVFIERPTTPGSATTFVKVACDASGNVSKVQPGDRVRVEVDATVQLITMQMIAPLFGGNVPQSLPITFVSSRSLLPTGGISTGPTTTPMQFSGGTGQTMVARTATAAAATAAAANATATPAAATSVASTATSAAATATSSAATVAALGAPEQTATIAAQQTATIAAQQTATAVVATAIANQTATAAAATATSVSATATAAALPPGSPTNFKAACGTANVYGSYLTFTWQPGNGTTNLYRIYDGDTLFWQGTHSPATPLATIPFSTTKAFSIYAINTTTDTSSGAVAAPPIACGRPIAINWVADYPTRDNGTSKPAYFKVTVTDVLSNTPVLSATVTVSGTNGSLLPLTTMTPGSGRYCYTWPRVAPSNADFNAVVMASYNAAVASTGVVTVTASNEGTACP